MYFRIGDLNMPPKTTEMYLSHPRENLLRNLHLIRPGDRQFPLIDNFHILII